MKLLSQLRRFKKGPEMAMRYLSFPKKVSDFRKLIQYRSLNLGMKELDNVIGGWAKRNVPAMSRSQCLKFH